MDNVLLVIQKLTKITADSTEKIAGQIFLLSDTKSVYFDTDTKTRKDITSECVVRNTLSELNSVAIKLINKLYISMDDNKIYRYDNIKFIEVTYSNEIWNTIYNLLELLPTIITDHQQMVAGATLSSQVMTPNGDVLSAAIQESKLLTVVRSSAHYYETKQAGQRIFDIQFPKENYGFQKGDIMTVVIRSQFIDTSLYEINDNCIIFDASIPDLNVGEIILVLFYYRMSYDLNNGVVLSSDNIADGAITTQKVSDDFRITAAYVTETFNRIFFTIDEKNKLLGIADNATNYHHPDTHPASMIVGDSTHRFLTDVKISEFEAKADSSDVYDKTEIDTKFTDLIGSTAMDTLNDLAAALNNDPDFAATMVNQLALKASITQLEAVQADVNKRTYVNDYIMNTIYGAPTMLQDVVLGHSNYTISVTDPTLLEYLDGMSVTIKIGTTNEASSYLRINELDYKKIVTQEGYDTVYGEFVVGSIYTLRYNATLGNFILQGKGGVKLVDTESDTYTIAPNETIKRGQICDINNNLVYTSKPKPTILSRTITTQDKFKCNGKIKVFSISDTEVVVFWIQASVLYGQKFLIRDNYIDINSTTGTCWIVGSSCIDFEIEKVDTAKFVVIYSDSTKLFTAKTATIDDSNFVFGTTYTRQESSTITNVTLVYLNSSKSIIAWQADQNTRTMYIQTPSTTIDIITSRDNINYPLDEVCKVTDTELIFGKTMTNNTITKWTMSIVSNDFYNSTLDTITTVDNTVTFSNLVINRINDTLVIFSATTSDLSKIYTWEIQVVFNNGSSVLNTYIDTTHTINQIKSLIPTKLKSLIYDGYYTYASTYDYNAPDILNTGMGPNCIKIAINEYNNGYNIVNSITDIYTVSNNISYNMINDNLMIVVFNYLDSSSISRLYFVLVDISKHPDCVSLADGITGATIKVAKW